MGAASCLSRLPLPSGLPLVLLEPGKDVRLGIENNLVKRKVIVRREQ